MKKTTLAQIKERLKNRKPRVTLTAIVEYIVEKWLDEKEKE